MSVQIAKQTIFRTLFFYFWASVAPAAISIIILPLYTHNLSTEDYGELALVISIAQILFTVISLGLSSGMVRSFGLADENVKNKIISTAQISSAFLAVFALVLIVFSSAIAHWFLPFPEGSTLFNLACIFCATNIILTIYLTHLRLGFKASFYTLAVVSRSLILLASVYLFLVVLNKGVIGAFFAQLVSIVIILVIFLITDKGKSFRSGFSLKEAKGMLKFGLWLIPGGMAGLVISISDRYFLAYFSGLTTVGLYSFGYQIASIVDLGFRAPFSLAWSPIIFRAFKNGNGEKINKEAFRYYNYVGIFLVLALSLFAKDLIQIFAPPNYLDAYTIVPIIALGLLIFGWENFLGTSLYVINKTYYFAIIFGIGAALNLGLNFALIPSYGMLGAALAMLISYVLIATGYYLVAQKKYPLSFEFNKSLYMLGIGGILYSAFLFCPISSLVYLIGFKLLLLMAYLLSGIWLRVISKNEVKEAIKLIKGIKRNGNNQSQMV